MRSPHTAVPSSALKCFGFALAALGLSFLFTDVALAQRYNEKRATLTEKEARALTRNLTTIMRGNSLAEADKEMLNKYFKGYYFPSMTRQDPKSLGELAEFREDLFKLYINQAKSKVVRDYLITLTGKEMGIIALGNYHPAVRYNAVLLIGMLDEEPADRGGKPPVPWKKGTNVLLILLEKDSLGSGDQQVLIPMSAKVGALVGLQRHARFGIDPAMNDRVTLAAMKLIDQQEPAEGVSKDVNAWVRCLAARVLVTQFEKSANQTVLDAVTSLIGDPEMQLDDRCYAAALLGELELEGVANLEVQPTTVALASLAKSVMQSEAKLAKKFRKKELGLDNNRGGGFGGGRGGYGPPGGGYGGEYGGGFGGGIGGRGKKENTYELRRLVDRINGLIDGMKQVAKASPEAQEKLQPLVDPLNSLSKNAVDKDASIVNIATSVISLSDKISQLAAAMQPGEAATEEPATDDAFEEAATEEEPVAAAG